MKKQPDVLGFELDEAILLLNTYDIQARVKESLGKEKIEKGIKRVISQKYISDQEVELIISYF